MLPDTLIRDLRKLNRADKLRALQLLISELASEEQIDLIADASYELLTPYGNEIAAHTLYAVLKAAEEANS